MQKWAPAYLLEAIGCALMPFLCIDAKPTGFQLKSGDAHPPVQNSANTYLIQSSQNSMIDWDGFSIDLTERVRFEQLHGNSYVLNRVVGGAESQLLGLLSSNGAVYLINPNGILIGPHAQIETAGFIASTLDLLDIDLSSLSFFGTADKGVVNQGKIHCPVGDIFLIGRTVENSGTLSAPAGQLGLLSGCDVLICPDRAPQVLIRSEDPVDPEVLNENPYSLAIRHSGKASAQEVYLITEKGTSEMTGTIAASKGEKGGHVRVLGDEVLLLGQAEIDVSGSRGGGEALFGGDYQGKNFEIKNAKHLFVEKEVKIRANALDEGNGGKVILWSDEATVCHGQVGIRGGEIGGDGGFAEISGAYLNFQGLVDGKALGAPGSLLLDPTNITISTGANSNGSFVANSWVSTGTPSVINTTTLQTNLASADTTIDTASAFGDTGTITVSNAVTWSAATKLTLIANGRITVSAGGPISNTNAGGAFDAISMTTTPGGSAAGLVGIAIAANVSTVSGNISLNGTSAATTGSAHGVSLTTGSVTSTGSGSITITGQSGPVTLGNGTAHGVNIGNNIQGSTGTISVTGTSVAAAIGCHGINLTTAWTSGTSGLVTISGTGASSSASIGVLMGGVFTGSGPVTFTNCTARFHAIGVISNFSTTGDIIATNNIQSGLGTGSIGFLSSVNFSTSGGSIQITASSQGGGGAGHGISLTGGSLNTTGGGSITLSGTGAVSPTASHGVNLTGGAGTVSTVTGNGSISITGTASSGAANFGVNIAGSNVAVINSTSGLITISGSSSSTTTGSHGVSIAAAWTPGTSGTVTFSNCTGGSGATSHGINVGTAFSAAGNVVATTNIRGGTGSGSVGFLSNANFSTSGVGSSIQITASSQATAGAAHGISLTGGSLSTTTGSITLIGTSGASSAASLGVNLNNATDGSIASTSGTISVTGISLATVAGSHGISIVQNWTSGTSALLTLTGTGGATGASHGINIPAALVNTGAITLNGTAGGGAGSFGNSFGANVTTSGGAITVTGSSILASTVTIDSTNSGATPAGADINFGSTINGTAAGSQALTLRAGTSGAVTFGGAIGATTRPGAITVTNARTTANAVNIGANITANSFTISTASPVTLTGSSTIDTSASAGVGIVFGSTIDGTSAGSQALTLTVNAADTISLPANVGATTRLGAFTISSGAAALSIGTAVTSIQANSFTVAGTVPTTVNVVGTLTVDTSGNNGNISFGGTVDGATAATQDLTLTAGTGAITLSGAMGSSVALRDLLLTGGAETISNSVFARNVTATNSGLLSIASSAPMSLTGFFLQNGAGLVQTAGNITTTAAGNIQFTTGVTLTGAVALVAGAPTGDITFSSTINGGFGLTLDGDVITFGSTVGATSPLDQILVSATGQINTTGNHTVLSGPMSYSGRVFLTTNTQFTDGGSSGISFQGSSTSISGNFNLTMLASSSSITVAGNINVAGAAGSAGGSVSATGGADLLFRGQILAQGDGAGAGGDVSLASSGGSVAIQNINTSSGTGIAGDITITPASGYSGGFPIGRVVINRDLSAGLDGNLVAQGTGGDGIVTLSANRASAATVATITSSVAGNGIEVLCGTFIMGPYEAMTALGDISLFASLSLTLGDVVAMTDLSPVATVINLLTHGDETLLDNNGFFYTSPSLHFLGGSAYTPGGTLIPSGPLNAQDINLSAVTFRSLLLYGDPTILNYDTEQIFPSPEEGRQWAVYQLGVASAQLSDLLPIFEPACPPIYRHNSERNCKKFVE